MSKNFPLAEFTNKEGRVRGVTHPIQKYPRSSALDFHEYEDCEIIEYKI